MANTFAGLGKKIRLFEEKNGAMKSYRQVLWGDWLEIDPNRQKKDGHLPILWAKNDAEKRKELWIKESQTSSARPLELIFVDVGQGDGCVMISPERGNEERIVIIDAGESDNMKRFIEGRFKAYRGFDFHAAVLTHPDKDHYLGFKEIFENQAIGFEFIYHNGLMELPVSGSFEKVGGVAEDAAAGIIFINKLWQTREEVERDFDDDSNFGDFEFPPVIHAALKNPKIDEIEMVSTHHGTKVDNRTYLPGFSPSDSDDYQIELLGPYVEFDSNGEPKLRRISSNYGKTKNGHSVLLRLTYGDFSVFFGGDLNGTSERFLLRKYTEEENVPRNGSAAYDGFVEKARKRFRSEIMKCCHHGATDVSDIFLDTVNPACFIISSGDSEGHVHPRPDLLGRLGRFGRGDSPVLLSTELQRSTREMESQETVDKMLADVETLFSSPTESRRDKLKSKIEKLAQNNVDVYGAIYVKTDGERLITAFKKETDSLKDRWFYFEYIIDENGGLKVVS